jgi:cytochrome d ubiquinol oxidase subunit II
MLQFALAFYGYGAAHLPYILYPYLTIYDDFTNQAMAVALITAFVSGLLLLIPSLYLLMRLFLFSASYTQGTAAPKSKG